MVLYNNYFKNSHSYANNIYLFRINRKNIHPLKNITTDYGWGEYSGSNVKVVYVKGEHHSLLYKENIDVVVKELKDIIKALSG